MHPTGIRPASCATSWNRSMCWRSDGVLTMFRKFLWAVVLLSAASMAFAAGAATPLQLKSVKVDLPDSDKMFPDGPGSDAINNNCLACHSAGMVLNQPALSKQAWAAEVNKMINNYKAPVALEDVGQIVEYLTTSGARNRRSPTGLLSTAIAPCNRLPQN